MSDWTPTQGLYLSFMSAYERAFGLPPSTTEIAGALAVTPAAVSGMLRSMEKKGLIDRDPGEIRSIDLLVDRTQLPKWKKKLSSNFRVWAPNDATPEYIAEKVRRMEYRRKGQKFLKRRHKKMEQAMAAGETLTVYRFQVTLNDFEPKIWRRFETLDVTLRELSALIQVAMGWQGYHLHQFTIHGQQFADIRFLDGEEGIQDDSGISVRELVQRHGQKLKMKYRYDFGDSWEHSVVLEKTFPLAESIREFPRCVDGKHACPPEDVGGVYRFAEFLEAIADPEHEEHEELLAWAGPYNFAAFSPHATTQEMQDYLGRL
jgi:hypothetical protein